MFISDNPDMSYSHFLDNLDMLFNFLLDSINSFNLVLYGLSNRSNKLSLAQNQFLGCNYKLSMYIFRTCTIIVLL